MKTPRLLKLIPLVMVIFFCACGCGKTDNSRAAYESKIEVKSSKDKKVMLVGDASQDQVSFLEGIDAYGALYDHYPRGEQLIKEGRFDEAETEFRYLING